MGPSYRMYSQGPQSISLVNFDLLVWITILILWTHSVLKFWGQLLHYYLIFTIMKSHYINSLFLAGNNYPNLSHSLIGWLIYYPRQSDLSFGLGWCRDMMAQSHPYWLGWSIKTEHPFTRLIVSIFRNINCFNASKQIASPIHTSLTYNIEKIDLGHLTGQNHLKFSLIF